jgi:hypothetical protein
LIASWIAALPGGLFWNRLVRRGKAARERNGLSRWKGHLSSPAELSEVEVIEGAGDRVVFARISVQPVSLCVTQSFEATLILGIRKFELDGRAVQLGNLLQLVDGDNSELSIFGTRFTSSEFLLLDSTGKKHEYAVYRQSRKTRAAKVGVMQVGPVFVKINYPISLRRSPQGGYEIAESLREIAQADAISVEVKASPLAEP